MRSSSQVVIKRGREKSIKNRHRWIFSGAVQSFPEFEDGSILDVVSAGGDFLCKAYFNKRCSIFGRVISFDETAPDAAVRRAVDRAVLFRKGLFDEKATNAYRLINGESDGLPGLTADYYNGYIVIQVSTLGMDKLKGAVVAALIENLNPKAVYERSVGPSRSEEGLAPCEGPVYGSVDGDISILENELKFGVDIRDGQKTGFFLDQREMRSLVMSFARGRTVLNCFCYTGAFSVYALKGGALRVDSVDSSESALVSARENVKTNGFDALSNRFYVADVFEFLRGADEYDLIILDPPAFAKKRSDVSKAMRGYRDINRVAMQKISRPGTILTSSCSYYIEDELFRKLIFQAALEARREVRVLQKHRLAYDHRLCVFHPESDYLKSYLLSVD